jgi:hypothetical protein
MRVSRPSAAGSPTRWIKRDVESDGSILRNKQGNVITERRSYENAETNEKE